MVRKDKSDPLSKSLPGLSFKIMLYSPKNFDKDQGQKYTVRAISDTIRRCDNHSHSLYSLVAGLFDSARSDHIIG